MHTSGMSKYAFSVEDGAAATHPDAVEDLANDDAAMTHARTMAHDFRGSVVAKGRMHVVVRLTTGEEIGRVPVPPIL